jgi:hypothetical protein
MKSRTITCRITAKTLENLRAAEHLARQASALDNTFIDVAVAFPNGREIKRTDKYRLSDYFDVIQVQEPENNTSFTMVFHAKPDAGNFWKDLAVWVIRTVRDSASDISITMAGGKS